MLMLDRSKPIEVEIVEQTKEIIQDTITGGKVAEADLDTVISYNLRKAKRVSAMDYTIRVGSGRGYGYVMDDYVKSPWDYAKIDRFILKEAYLSRSIERHVETMLRNGFQFNSDKPEYLSIVNKIFSDIARNTSRDLNSIIGEMASRLKKYGIFFTAMVKETKNYKNGTVKTLSDIRFIHPGKVTVRMKKGKVKSYEFPDSYKYFGLDKSKEITPHDMFVCSMDDNSELFFPVPPCIASFNDVLTLRSIEETVELLCFQFGSPLLHAKVGTDNREGTDNEVSSTHSQIVRMAANGFITTSNRVKLDVVNIQSAMSNLEPSLTYFKTRLLAGIGISPVSLGEGDTSNRSTADSIESALSDNCARVANTICNMFNYKIIPDILMSYNIKESEIFDSNGLPVVSMDFNEMRMEKQTLYENHIMNLFNSNAITYDEYRTMLNKPKLSEKDMKNLKFNLMPEKAPDGTNALVKSTTSPQNQHGTKGAPGSLKN